MKKLTLVLGLLVLLGSTGIAAADPAVYVSGPRVVASVAFPGLRLVFGRPNVYCWYQGRYYSRVDWDRFHRDCVAYNRFHRDNDRRFDRDHGRF
jgi:hypothetical protein